MNILDRLDQLEREATLGPWRPTTWYSGPKNELVRHGVNGQYPDGSQPAMNAVAEMLEYIPEQPARVNAELIALSRSHLRALLDVARAANELTASEVLSPAPFMPIDTALAPLLEDA